MTTPQATPNDQPGVTRSAASMLSAVSIWFARTVTPMGWFVLSATALSAVLAVSMGLVEYAVIAIFGFVVLVIALPYLLGRAPSRVALRLEHERVVVGSGASVQVEVRNESRRPLLPGSVEVLVNTEVLELQTPIVAPRQHSMTQQTIPTPQRGVFQVGPATMVRQDPLGMFRRSRTDNTVRTLFVHPATVSLPSATLGLIRDLDGNPSATIVDADIAFHAIRPYMPGDAQRHIHWKSTAKIGALMVKQFEETRRSRLTMLLAAEESEYRSGDEFELAVSVVASVAARSIADARDTEVLISPSVREHSPAKDRRVRALNTASRRALLDQLSALILGQASTTVDHLGSRAATSRQNASLLMVVVGSTVTYRQIRKATLPFGPDVQVVAVSCDPLTPPGLQRIGNLTLLRVGVLSDLQKLLIRGALE